MPKPASLIDQCTNLYGPLPAKIRQRIRAVLENPCQETWEEAHALIISETGMMTLWQAWIAVDPKAPVSRPCDRSWPRIPDPFTLYRAIRLAVDDPKAQHRAAQDRLQALWR